MFEEALSPVGVALGWDRDPPNVQQEVEAWHQKVKEEPVPDIRYSTGSHERVHKSGFIEVPSPQHFVARAAQAIIEAAATPSLKLLQIGPVPATSLPEALGHLPLRHLSISDTACTTLPFLGKRTELRHLSLKRHPRLISLPHALGHLEKLNWLTIEKCEQLQSLPPLGGLRSLQSLIVRQCPQLEKLPAGLGNLTELRTLDLQLCAGLKELPADLEKLTHLGELDLRYCTGLKKLPESLRQLPEHCRIRVPIHLEEQLAELRNSELVQPSRLG